MFINSKDFECFELFLIGSSQIYQKKKKKKRKFTEECTAAGGARCLSFSPLFFEGQQVGIRRIHCCHGDLVVKRS